MATHSESIWTKNFVLLMISNALLWMAFEMLTPTLPLFIESIGGSPSQIGLLIGALTISAMVIRLFTSSMVQLMDKKYILIIALMICVLATGSYIFSYSLLALCLFRLLHGLGIGVATTFYITLTSEYLPEKRLGEGLGYFGMGEAICLSIGPLLGIQILNIIDFNGLFISGAGITLIAALILLGISRHPVNVGESPESFPKKISFIFLERSVLPQCILSLLLGVTTIGVISFTTLFAKQQNIDGIAWFFFITAIMGLVFRGAAGKLYDTKGPLCVLVPSGLCFIVSMVLIAYSQSALQLNIAAVFYGTGLGCSFPALQAWIINLVEPDRREAATSSFLNFFDLGIAVGAVFLGLVIEATSYKTMYLLLAGILVAFIVLTVYAVNIEARKIECEAIK